MPKASGRTRDGARAARGAVGLALFAWLGASAVVEAGTNVWTGSGPPGGTVLALVSTPTAVYAGTEGSGVFKSTDGGTTWVSASVGLRTPRVFPLTVRRLAADPSDGSTLYAGTDEGGVFKTTDGGATWTAINRGLPGYDSLRATTSALDDSLTVRALAVDPSAAGTIYASVGTTFVLPDCPTGGFCDLPVGGVFKSTDGGATWREAGVGLPGDVLSLAIDPARPTTLFAAGVGGVSRSTDGGARWEFIAALGSFEFQLVWVDPRNPGTVYAARDRISRSTDGGATWRDLGPVCANCGRVVALVGPTAQPATLYTGVAGRGVFRSVDEGQTWTPTGLDGLNAHALVTDATRPDMLFAATGALTATDSFFGEVKASPGVLRSTDGGSTWSPANAGLTATRVAALAVEPTTPAILYAATLGSGVLKTTDGGATWNNATTGPTSFAYSLAIDPSDPTTIFAIGNNGRAGEVRSGELFRSTNGGATWTRIDRGFVGGLAVAPTTPATLYVAGSSAGVSRSTDGGATWTDASLGLPAARVIALAIDPVTPTTLYAVTGFGTGLSIRHPPVFKSTDGGTLWRIASTGLPDVQIGTFFFASLPIAIDPVTPTTLYVALPHSSGASEYAVFRSTDGGANWTLRSLVGPAVSSLAVDPARPTTIYAGTRQGVFRSADGGATWGPLNTGLASLDVQALTIVPTSPSTVYVGTRGGGVAARQDAPSVRLSPPSGRYVPSQAFDFVVVVDAPGRSIVSGSATVDGRDVTGVLVGCVVQGTIGSGGRTFRCPGLSGALLGPGSHAITVTLGLDDGSRPSATVTWEIASGGAPPATASTSVSPPSGALVATQRFDLVVASSGARADLAVERATLDGFDVTGLLAACAVPEAVPGLGAILRCPAVSGALLDSLGTGPHHLSVTVRAGAEPETSASVTWEVVANTEP